jgi:hypothetical protein
MEHHSGGTWPGQAIPPNAADWLLQVTDESDEERAHWDHVIARHLQSHPTVNSWMRSRPALRETPHFARYRAHRYRLRYDNAVRALGNGSATAEQYDRVTLLSAEIASSPLILRSGQVLLCGEVDAKDLAFTRYNPFLWATVHPRSAARSADASFAPTITEAQPTVYVFRLECTLPALFGRTGLHGWCDVLLPRRLRLSVDVSHEGRRYQVREGRLGL